MSAYTHQNSPNPAKLIQALRHLGYDNEAAISDLIDNCWDANARTVKVFTHSVNGVPEIVIADDGNGMNCDVLGESIRLGSMVEKDVATDLGRFGMGLVTASMSIARQTVILTKVANGELLKAINDVDEVIRTNEFISYLDKADLTDSMLFSKYLPNAVSGTVVILRKCDGLKQKPNEIVSYGQKLGKHVARIFREFISSDGRSLYVNSVQVEALDPLKWDHPQTERFSDDTLEIKYETAGGTMTDTVRIKLAILPDDSAVGQKEKEATMRTQGFYIMRNHREISDAETLGLFAKHNSMNRFRAEIHFSGALDDFMGVSFTKTGIRLGQSASDQFRSYLRGQIETIRRRIVKSQRVEVPDDVKEVHQGAEKEIHKKAKLLLTPESVAPKPLSTPPKPRNGRKTEPGNPTTPKGIELKETHGFATNCKFEVQPMGEGALIYEPEQVGKTIIIRWNSDHPFYKRFVLDNIQDKGMLAAADYLVYSLACAELMYSKEENRPLIQSFKTAISMNLRVLLG